MASTIPTGESANEVSTSTDGESCDDITESQSQAFIYQQIPQNSEELTLIKNFLERIPQNSEKRFMIVTAGKSGVGKSTLIKNFLELEDNVLEACLGPTSVTKEVKPYDKEIKYENEIRGVQLRVIDMPGLHSPDTEDITEDLIHDLKALTEDGIDVIFYCINLINRLDKVDYENMDTLTQIFGQEIWNRVIFVFTHTDVTLPRTRNLETLIEQFTLELQKYLVESRRVNVEIRSIYSFPTEQSLRDEEMNKFKGVIGIPVSDNIATPAKWRDTLRLQVLRKCRKENIQALLQLSRIDWYEVAKFTAGVAGVGIGRAAVIGGARTAPTDAVHSAASGSSGAALEAISTAAGASLVAQIALVLLTYCWNSYRCA